MRCCSRCKIKQEETAFHRKRNGLQTECKACKKLYIREHYQKNKTYYVEKAKLRTQKIRQTIGTYKESHPCSDCGQKFPACAMDFDHRERGDKIKEIATLISRGNLETLIKEIEKCDLVCSNCHRIRTHLGSRIPSAS